MFTEGGKRVIIVGGGATSVLLACHLLRNPSSNVRVTIVEKGASTGLGLAYSTGNPRHLLNVRASNMSAFPDDPNHFWNWVIAKNFYAAIEREDSLRFVPRRIYGQYLEGLLEAHLNRPEALRRLEILRGECVSVRLARGSVEIKLRDGTSHIGQIAVLATGNEASPAVCGYRGVDPWTEPANVGIGSDETILILGTGLTMVDYVLSVVEARRTGPLVAISRRGLLPQAHRHVEPLRIDPADVPFGSEISYVMKWVRDLVDRGHSQNLDWRSVLDGLRPFIQEIWQNWPNPTKQRFLRHARAWWDAHRHRTAPEVNTRLQEAISTGMLKVLAAKVTAIEPHSCGATVIYRRRGATAIESIQVCKVVECLGVAADASQSSNPVIQNLLKQGYARADPIGFGIEVATDCAVIDRCGKVSQDLFAVGPLTRGTFWEITSIPDIRIQCERLAGRISDRLAATH